MNDNTNKGIGFVVLLTIVFITLKLLGVISRSWLWVLSPIWINIGLGAIVILSVIIYKVIKEVC
ncbi:MAG: hypothetical protein E6248_00435 [Clostridium sp.]|uniref:hypothetical protein n=1 Tax=Clostridium sp. TaxID=1506 RepID=UPI0029114218|nr:hypothetical protein [Clostridium sp.]MDU5108883.1 hypothetical protein [Clostridium sp.]